MSVTGVTSTNPAAAAGSGAGALTSLAGNTDVSQGAFLKLLVAQIKNQDPLNPADGTQFLSELAQFSQLEQLIGIKQEVAKLNDTSTATEKKGD